MTIQTTYTQARASLASLMDEVTKKREVVIIQRRGRELLSVLVNKKATPAMEKYLRFRRS